MTNKDVQKMTVTEMYEMFLKNDINSLKSMMIDLEVGVNEDKWQLVGYLLTRMTSKVFDIINYQEQVRIFKVEG